MQRQHRPHQMHHALCPRVDDIDLAESGQVEKHWKYLWKEDFEVFQTEVVTRYLLTTYKIFLSYCSVFSTCTIFLHEPGLD